MNQNIPSDFFIAYKRIYNLKPFQCSYPVSYKENSDYGACTFVLNGRSIQFRTAKITPTKTGQFVTLWKRIGNNPIQSFDYDDDFDLFVISVSKDNHTGQFIFSKAILYAKDIISKNNIGGKRAIRVYPPWDKTTSPQATRTQKWQLDYFLDLSSQNIDLAKASQLYGL